jgi:hypothetical protein
VEDFLLGGGASSFSLNMLLRTPKINLISFPKFIGYLKTVLSNVKDRLIFEFSYSRTHSGTNSHNLCMD